MAKSPEYDAMSIDELKAVIAAAQAALDVKVEARRAELMAELQALGGPVKAKPKAEKVEGDARAAVKPMYRGPNSEEWSGRGAMPKWAKALGITDKAGLEPYRIRD